MSHTEAVGSVPAHILNPRAPMPDVDESGNAIGPMISARFFVGNDPTKDMHNNEIVTNEGEIPQIEMVEIINRNDPKNSPMIQRATDWHRYKRFPREFAMYQEGRTAEMSGTSLKEWLGDNGRTQKLAQYNIFTAEQLAGASDSLCQSLGPGTIELRRKAISHLAANKDSALTEKVMAKNDALERQITEMKNQLDRFMKAQAGDSAKQGTTDDLTEIHPAEQVFTETPRNKGGRPRKPQEGI